MFPAPRIIAPTANTPIKRANPTRCPCGRGVLKFYKLTGEKNTWSGAGIARTIAKHVAAGNARRSPLPFRVNLSNGKVLDAYTAHMVAPVLLLTEMIDLGEDGGGVYESSRDTLWKWVSKYPVKNNGWTGFYEDVNGSTANRNQQSPMETARFMLRHPEFV